MPRTVLASCAAVLACAAGLPSVAATLVVDVTDGAGKPVEGAVVAVSVAGAPKTAAAGATARIVQKDRQFVPRITVVQAGTAVSFPNLDTVRHHVYSFSPARTFELKLYAGTPAEPVVFDKPGTAVLGCNIHDRMAAWVVVVDTPHFALSDAQGKARLELPDGEHLLRAWPAQREAPQPVERRVRGGAGVVVVQLAPSAGA